MKTINISYKTIGNIWRVAFYAAAICCVAIAFVNAFTMVSVVTSPKGIYFGYTILFSVLGLTLMAIGELAYKLYELRA